MNQVQRIPQSFRKSTQNLAASLLAVGLGLFAGATHSTAANLTWTASSGDFGTASNWDPALSPAAEDKTFFTNDTSDTVSFSTSTPVMDSNTFSNHTGVATLNLGANTWTVTNTFYVGKGDATSTVYLAGGTLSVGAVVPPATAQLRIGDPTTNLFSCVGALFVTNGIVEVDAGTIVGANSNGVGKLVISGPGLLRQTVNSTANLLTVGNGSSGSQLIVTNGGTLFVDGTLTVGSAATSSNNSAFFAGPTSRGTITAGGFLRTQGNGTSLIVSNGAKVSGVGSILLGASASWCTSIVVGAGSALIAGGSMQAALGSTGATNNLLSVYDGGFISCGGTFAYGNNVLNVSNGVQFGGTGLMSTGLLNVVRSASNNTNHFGNFFIVTNAFVSCTFFNPQGPQETIAILTNGTLKLTNSISIAVPAGNSNSVNMNGVAGSTGPSTLMINNGTLDNSLTADNVGGISLGGVIGGIGLILTNNGKLLSGNGTIGAGSPGNTSIVVGAGSVWSNFSGIAGYTNELIVGTGAGGSNNVLLVADGGTLYNNGTLNIGKNSAAVGNVVRFGSAGTLSTVINVGSLNIGATATNYGNVLTVTNATLNCGTINVGNTGSTNNLLDMRGGTVSVNFIRVRPTNTVVFNAGTLSVGALTYDTLASPSTNAFVVGDGTSAAYYDMAAGGSGDHNFNDGGLVVTNGAYLRGAGVLLGAVKVYGTFVPGASNVVGSIVTSNSLQFGTSAILNYDLGTSQDSVTVGGSLILGGTVNVTSNAGFTATTYTLFTHTNTVSGTLAVGVLPPGYSATVSTNSTQVQLNVTSIGGADPYTTWATTTYGLSGASALGTADPDGDGMSNTNEFLAGFNPTNSAARLTITNITKTDGTNVTIAYLGASGDISGSPGPKTNVLEYTTGTPPSFTSTNFVSTGLTNELTGGTGLGQPATFVETNGATGPARYYRVKVLLP